MNSKTNGRVPRKEQKKEQKAHKSRLIIRNLSFKTTEDDIRSAFSTYGTLVDVNMPKKPDGQFRGFAFVAFDNMGSSLKAIKNLNGKQICDRTVAVDFSVDKTTYDKAMEEKKQNEPVVEVKTEKKNVPKTKKVVKDQNNNIPKPTKKPQNKKKVNIKAENVQENDTMEVDEVKESEDEEMDVDEKMEIDFDEKPQTSKKERKAKTDKPKKDDVTEGRTIFIRGLDLETGEEAVAELFKQFGDIVYCKICMNPYTEKSKGTAFVLFKSKDSADKCLKEAATASNPMFYLEGQQLLVSLALERNRLYALEEEKRNKYKDKRNLYLAKEGLIYPKSPSAVGVSQQDLKKRVELEERKRKVLQNLHHYISDRRLCVHNIPANYSDKKLQDLFFAAADDPTAKITWAKVMRNRVKQENSFGNTKGFGFVEFADHWHALKALRYLNNNPDVWTPERRPIVEFSVENKVAVNIKKYREMAFEKKKVEQQNKVKQEVEEANEAVVEKKKTKNRGRRKSRNERIAGQKARAASGETITTNQGTSGKKTSDTDVKEINGKQEVDYSGVQSKPTTGKVIVPKMNRKIHAVKDDLLKNKRLLKKDKRKAENKKRHLINLEKKKDKQKIANEVTSKRYREQEDDAIDSHFHKRKHAFMDSLGAKQLCLGYL